MNDVRVDDVAVQYRSPDPLQVRIDTHRRYSERFVDLDREGASLLNLASGDSVLDAGCGTGAFLRYLSERGHTGTLVGLDQSPGMIAGFSSSPGIDGLVGDVMALPFADSAFTWTVARHMLYHVDDIATALRELVRVARKGVLLCTGSRESMPHLMSMRNHVVAQAGMQPDEPVMGRFCIENVPAWLESVSIPYETCEFDSALVFTEPEPMVRYVMSCLPSFGITEADAGYPGLERTAIHLAETLIREHGTVRDSNRVAFYVMRKL